MVKPAISTHVGQFQSWENNKEGRGTGTFSFSPEHLIDNLTLLMLFYAWICSKKIGFESSVAEVFESTNNRPMQIL